MGNSESIRPKVERTHLVEIEVDDCNHQLGELGAGFRLRRPAIAHQGIEGHRTAFFWDFWTQSLRYKTKNLFISDVIIRQSTESKHFPTEHAKGPNVTVQSELRDVQDLWRHPSYW